MTLLLQKRGYFWDEFNRNSRNWFNLQLFENRYVVNLQDIYGGYMWKYGPKCKTKEEYYDELTRQKFYDYLLPILQRGELKMQVADEVEIPVTKADIKKDPSIKNLKTQWEAQNIIRYEKPEQAEEAIADLKKRWEKHLKLDARALDMFENFAIYFTLPENEWPY
ncbi:MAG TPA: hypothetical protein PLQ36_01365 [Candidatus Gracilibacteria bacterium]|nr:hypothetical protein [Candidatus Gracilibacteria bacterium]